MDTTKHLISKLTTPRHLTPENGIHFWQEKVLLSLLMVSAVLGFFICIPSVALAIKEELWLVAAIDILFFCIILGLFLTPGLSYTLRAIGYLIISYFLGMILLLTLGPFGAGPVWLFFFPILTGVLMGSRPASMALVINGITIVAVSALIHLNLTDMLSTVNLKGWYLVSENPLEKWVVTCLNFMLLNILATLSVTTILNETKNTARYLKIYWIYILKHPWTVLFWKSAPRFHNFPAIQIKN